MSTTPVAHPPISMMPPLARPDPADVRATEALGPWTTDPTAMVDLDEAHLALGYDTALVVHAADRDIAYVVPCADGPDDGRANASDGALTDGQRAAALIAAAPELFAACRAVLTDPGASRLDRQVRAKVANAVGRAATIGPAEF